MTRAHLDRIVAARVRRGPRGVCAALLGSLVAACGVVMDSYQIDPVVSDAQPQTVCQSDLGTYALPKAFVHIKVGQGTTGPPDIVVAADTSPAVEVLRHPDRSLVFCLDYLASSLHHDAITIRKAPAYVGKTTTEAGQDAKTSFLGAVMVNAQDRTVYIVEALLRAAFIAASGDAGFTPRNITTGNILADLEYDPFDPRESAEVNARLTSLGVCLILEGGYTFDRDHVTVESYCNAPRAHAAWLTPIVKAYVKAEQTPANPHLPGLLYRPRVPYRLAIFRKLDPKGSDRWRLGETQVLKMENLSPVLSLDIRRTVFAGRNANFVFDSGALLTACVAKGSEVEGFVDIPLQISRSLVALPTSMLKVRINQTDNETKLAQAEAQLFKVQAAYLAALSSGNFTAPTGTPGAFVPPAGTPTSLGLPTGNAAFATDGVITGTAPAYGGDAFSASTSTNLANLCAGTGG